MSKLNTLKAEFERLTDGIETIKRAAEEAGRDLTDEEEADTNKLYERAAELKPLIEAESAKHETISEVSSILARVSPDVHVHRSAKPEPQELTAGEFLCSAFKAQAGVISQDEHLERAAKYIDRATQTTSDSAGLLPVPIVGNLIELYDSSRPVFNSFTPSPMPSAGSTFNRPKVTQHVATGDQASEFDPVSTQKMTVGYDAVDKFTEAGYLDLSAQDIDWTDPAALQLVVRDFIKVYNRRMDERASAYLQSNVVATSGWDISDVGAAVGTFVDAFHAVNSVAEEEADTVWLDYGTFAAISKLTNTGDDRTAFSMIAEALSEYGVNGVKWVKTRNFLEGATPGPDAGVRIVGSSRLVESYEQTKGLLQVAQPSVLGQRIATYAYGAFFITPAGFVSLEA